MYNIELNQIVTELEQDQKILKNREEKITRCIWSEKGVEEYKIKIEVFENDEINFMKQELEHKVKTAIVKKPYKNT